MTFARLALATILLFSYAGATTITDDYGLSNGDVIGDLNKFDIQSLSVNMTRGATDLLTIDLLTNYNLGDTTLGDFPNWNGSRQLSVGDILFSTLDPNSDAVTFAYGIPLRSRTGSPNLSAPNDIQGSVTAGTFYQSTTGDMATAREVLSNPPNSAYRPDDPVWMKPAGLLGLSAGSITVTRVNGGSLLDIQINVDLGANSAFGNEFFGNGLVVSFASATCANDVIGGLVFDQAGDNPTPEPLTMALTGAGLLGLGILRRRRAS